MKITVCWLVCKVRCYCFFRELAAVLYSIESSVKSLRNRQVLHTTPECGFSMIEATGNVSSKELLSRKLSLERDEHEGQIDSSQLYINAYC